MLKESEEIASRKDPSAAPDHEKEKIFEDAKNDPKFFEDALRIYMASKLEENGVLNEDVKKIDFEDIIKNNPGGTIAKYAGLLESRFVNELIAEGRTDSTDEVIDPYSTENMARAAEFEHLLKPSWKYSHQNEIVSELKEWEFVQNPSEGT
eukprot:UN00830